ncbi:glucose-6-phosphate dehydrogenase assembly protein OpcA [Planctomyces sp. SH-PL62]|uniref:glucose-6-phosphate dehydrogenase assembly protein OpcA n=1 Tax=Planctomyces sp. SH-PL62 TaxID=1636152 RepID=UPI00078B19E2|nr:glucose-6-phosphate dehydrogenase assembly protein OpcA [Planctomyces sp. SH-PL62]AMV36318.1 Glucose-6-phosphate dehydrogenase subunit [Planctomyces sp. SH-PL62]
MTETSSDAFLEGQGIPVPLAEIDATLEKLWGPAAERAGGPELEHPTVTRVVLANLVVERLSPDAEELRPVVETVVGRFPCRAIVIRESDDPGRQVSAEVSAVCKISEPGAAHVCAERIVLHAGPAAIDLIPGAVRPLLEVDLPMILWWTTDPVPREKLYRDLAAESSRIMLDLPDPGASAAALRLGLDPAIGSCRRDAVWYGLTHWRELIAQIFDCPIHRQTLGRIESVRIDALSPAPSTPPRLALWLAAWLAAQLGWERRGTPRLVADGEGSTFRAEFGGPAGPIALEIGSRPLPDGLPATPRLVGVALTARGDDGPESFRLQRTSPESPDVRIHVDAPDYCRIPNIVHADALDPAHRIAAALELSRFDAPFEKATPFLLWMMEHAEAVLP